jgi:hypothetical protein
MAHARQLGTLCQRNREMKNYCRWIYGAACCRHCGRIWPTATRLVDPESVNHSCPSCHRSDSVIWWRVRRNRGRLGYAGVPQDPARFRVQDKDLRRIIGRCRNCGRIISGSEAIPAPEPFHLRISGDETLVVQCYRCNRASTKAAERHATASDDGRANLCNF